MAVTGASQGGGERTATTPSLDLKSTPMSTTVQLDAILSPKNRPDSKREITLRRSTVSDSPGIARPPSGTLKVTSSSAKKPSGRKLIASPSIDALNENTFTEPVRPLIHPRFLPHCLKDSALDSVAMDPAAVSLVPALLPEEMPLERVRAEFPKFADAETFHLDRFYEFSFLPHGLFSRFMVRVLDYTTPIFVWGSGMLARSVLNEKDKLQIRLCEDV